MNTAALRARWETLAPREKLMVAATTALVVLVLVWLVALRPALNVLRSSERQQRELDAQVQQMMVLRQQARSLRSQPKLGRDEAQRLLEQSLRQRLGVSARLVYNGDRATVTLTGTPPDALANWITQARVDARALPSEAHLTRSANGQWNGTIVLSLPSR
ncbi:MAG TPA: type II secretion system protein GspM [Ramlibacter sp.]|nr:type II secretion system protein GspM [Ramlibacter sp.]